MRRQVKINGVYYTVHAIVNGVVEYFDHNHPCNGCDDQSHGFYCENCTMREGYENWGYLGSLCTIPLKDAEVIECK